MKTIYFVRHGQSEANAQRITAGGGLDVGLTKSGVDQAARVGKLLKNKKIQLIISSPMKRAHHTAVVIANEIGYKPADIVLNELFTERHLGELTGKAHDDVQIYFDIGATPPGGESTEAMHDRILKGLEWIKTLDAERIVLVSHGGPGRMLRSIYREESHKSINSLRSIGNSEVLELQL